MTAVSTAVSPPCHRRVAAVSPPCHRCLGAAKIAYVNQRSGQLEPMAIFADSGGWNLRNVSFVEPSSCQDWGIVMCVPEVREAGLFDDFAHTFEKIARERNVKLGNYLGVERYDERKVDQMGLGKFLDDAAERLGRGKKPGLLVCGMGGSLGENTPTCAASATAACATAACATAACARLKLQPRRGGAGMRRSSAGHTPSRASPRSACSR